MSSNEDLLPMPEWQGDFMTESEFREEAHAYARACVAHATAAKDAEIEALRAEVARRVEGFADRAEQLEARAERLAA
ncbi:hypothetical protein H9645_03800 [Luteimonas sp. Sa2BVA3]|uniref:Uncharacterized protein n=1 Tax=Luteimonas colneyensis TaxID=2762230 RepID=A0ABR8UGJ2_9GAMM|nr:hypothetical protein [Luteimonas colneyensis]MBD7987146.1 hypothetical protein [Luteimonas colneyensis]